VQQLVDGIHSVHRRLIVAGHIGSFVVVVVVWS
jgi:hypothetical protein